MSIDFVCPCGRHFRVPDDLAGKAVRCRSCRAPIRVPTLQSSRDRQGFVEEKNSPVLGRGQTKAGPGRDQSAEPEEDDRDLELVDDRPPVVKGRPILNDAAADEERERYRNRQTEFKDPEQDKGMAEFYKSETPAELSERSEEMRRKKRRKARRRREEDEVAEWLTDWAIGSSGLTMFGVHVTAGVIGGSFMLFSGLIFLGVMLTGFSGGYYVTGRIIGGTIAYTILGVAILVRSLFYGEEE